MSKSAIHIKDPGNYRGVTFHYNVWEKIDAHVMHTNEEWGLFVGRAIRELLEREGYRSEAARELSTTLSAAMGSAKTPEAVAKLLAAVRVAVRDGGAS